MQHSGDVVTNSASLCRMVAAGAVGAYLCIFRLQMKEIEAVPCDPGEFKSHQLPLARIKKVGSCWLGE